MTRRPTEFCGAPDAPAARPRDALGHASVTMTNTYLGLAKGDVKKNHAQRTAHRARQALRVV